MESGPVNHVSNGHTPSGKFAVGNRLGKGNPNARRMHELRQQFLDAVQPETIPALARKLQQDALGGDLDAAKLLLDYCLGRPQQAVALTDADGGPLGVNVHQVTAVVLDALADDPVRRIEVASRLMSLDEARDADGPNRRIALALDPSLVMDELGFVADNWQRLAIRSRSERLLLLTHRQAGKSTSVAALAVATILAEPDALVLLVSASQRQSDELFLKVKRFYKGLGEPIPIASESAVVLGLVNGARVVSLPDSPDTIAGFSAPRLVVIDEAARTSDESYMTVSPMLLRSRGRLVAMSTPLGARGWFHAAWQGEGEWERVEFRASENPRLDPEYLASERRRIGDRWYMQDYECSFEDAVGQVFSSESIDMAFTSEKTSIFEACHV